MDNNSISNTDNTEKNEMKPSHKASSLRPRRTIAQSSKPKETNKTSDGASSEKTELFTDRVIIDDDIDIVDIDAYRREKQERQRAEEQKKMAQNAPQSNTRISDTAPRHPARAAESGIEKKPAPHVPEIGHSPSVPMRKTTDAANVKEKNIASRKAEQIAVRNGLPVPDAAAFDTMPFKKAENDIAPEAIQEEELKNRNTGSPRTKNGKTSNHMSTLVKALVYIASVLLVSCICAYFIVVVANDVFAFVKEDSQIDVTVSEYPTLREIANELHDQKVIKYPKMFVLYNTIKNDEITSFIGGTVTVSPTQNYDELIRSFVTKSKPKKEVSITIPEGYTVDETIDLLVSKGIGTREGFVDAIQNYEYDYWFVKDMTNLDPNRKYRLEGYLYPDTYYFYQDWEEWRVINKLLANFSSKFSVAYKEECAKLGMTVDDVIKLASVIQMETKYTSEYSAVSSVIHNRLNSVYYRRMLECDATIQYFLPERKTRVLTADTKINNPYNSYLYAGLPPGPICNPTLTAIKAALYPDNTNYYFFVAMKNGHLLFAKNITEHERNKATAQIGT